MDKTTIEIRKTTRRKLKVYAAKRDQTYDEAIEHLLEEASNPGEEEQT